MSTSLLTYATVAVAIIIGAVIGHYVADASPAPLATHCAVPVNFNAKKEFT